MKIFFNMLIILGVAFIIGTAGASDLDNITISQTLKQIFASLVFIGLGLAGKLVFGKKKIPVRKIVVKRRFRDVA